MRLEECSSGCSVVSAVTKTDCKLKSEGWQIGETGT